MRKLADLAEKATNDLATIDTWNNGATYDDSSSPII